MSSMIAEVRGVDDVFQESVPFLRRHTSQDLHFFESASGSSLEAASSGVTLGSVEGRKGAILLAFSVAQALTMVVEVEVISADSGQASGISDACGGMDALLQPTQTKSPDTTIIARQWQAQSKRTSNDDAYTANITRLTVRSSQTSFRHS